MGLTPNTVVIVGAQDQKISAYGAGITGGTLTLSLGTAAAMVCVTKEPRYHAQMKIPIFSNMARGEFVIEPCIYTVGGAIKWVRDTLLFGLNYDEMNMLAARSVPGSNGVRFFPFLSGAGTPHMVTEAKAGFEGMSLGTTRSDIIHALYESIAFECRSNIDELRAMGACVSKIHAFGGGSKSDVLCQLIADVTSIPVISFIHSDLGSLGCAKLVFRALGYERAEFGAEIYRNCKSHCPAEGNEYEVLYAQYAERTGLYLRHQRINRKGDT